MKLNFVLLVFICVASSKVFALNEEIIINISAKGLANERINIAFPYLKEKVMLDSNGKGQINVPFKNKTFAILSFYKGQTSIYRILFFDKDYNISIGIKGRKFSFDGQGSQINQLILNCDNFIEPQEKKIQQMYDQDKPINDIVSSYLKLDFEFEKFYKNQRKKVLLDRESDYLLHNHFIATLLGRKQQMISLLSIEEADSLNLIKILGISPNPLFKDSILVKAGSVSLKNFLTWNNDFNLMRAVPFAVVGAEKYAQAVDDYILNDSTHSTVNKEHLMFANLAYCMSNLGVTKEIDGLIEKFYNRFPKSVYNVTINELKTKFDALTMGKPAPNWTLESFDGKTYSLEELKGEVIFIDVWATWCIPCIKAMPSILEYQKQYSNITFLFISIDKDTSQWKKFLNKHTENNGINLISGNSDFEKLYRISGVPRQILIDKERNIIDAFIDHEDLQKLLETYSN